jgi:hypothetical protein
LGLLAHLEARGTVPDERVQAGEVAYWSEVVNLVMPKGEASLGIKAVRTIWVGLVVSRTGVFSPHQEQPQPESQGTVTASSGMRSSFVANS